MEGAEMKTVAGTLERQSFRLQRWTRFCDVVNEQRIERVELLKEELLQTTFMCQDFTIGMAENDASLTRVSSGPKSCRSALQIKISGLQNITPTKSFEQPLLSHSCPGGLRYKRNHFLRTLITFSGQNQTSYII